MPSLSNPFRFGTRINCFLVFTTFVSSGFLIPGTELKIPCVGDEYYSESAETCLPCPTKCSPSGTKECNTKCIECPLYHYVDNVTGTCQRCDELCHQAEVRGTEKRCQKLCPVERPVEVKHEETHTRLTEALVNPRKPPRSSNDRSPLSILVVTLLVAVCLLAVVGIVVMMDEHRKLHAYLCIKSVRQSEGFAMVEENC